MKRSGYFFERHEYSDAIDQPHYRYRGYRRTTKNLDRNDPLCFPVSLHFDRDEIIFTFQEKNGHTHRIFSLYVAEGPLNQQMLIRKVENYWKMPFWDTPRQSSDISEGRNPAGGEKEKFILDPGLLRIGFFTAYNGLEIGMDATGWRIEEWRPFKLRRRQSDPYSTESEWRRTEDGAIATEHINFRQLLLDFLFELDNFRTFEDKNFFRLQPILQDNILLDALSRKGAYLSKLRDLRMYERQTSTEKLPKKFRDAEYAWLNACFQEMYQDLFTSAASVFGTVEEEVENVFFKTRIGRNPKPRIKRFSRRDTDVRLRNQAATFFLRRYSIKNAFRVLLPPFYTLLIIAMFIGMPLGDYLGDTLFNLHGGFFCVGIPLAGLAGIIGYYAWQGINLFKLLLPRMFLGIVVGWATFWDTTEVWETALINNQGKIALVSAVLLVILCLYVFTNISNKLIRVPAGTVFRRTIGLVSFAMLISFMIGFYVIQFKAVPVLNVSDFPPWQHLIQSQALNSTPETAERTWQKKEKIGKPENGKETVATGQGQKQSHIERQKKVSKRVFGLKNFTQIKFVFGGSLYYIWSLLFSQFMVAIMIGVMLQLLWEDRAITEPL